MPQKTYIRKNGEEVKYWDGKIPFSEFDDHPLDYDYGNRYYTPNEPFWKSVEFSSFERGRSAVRAVYIDTDNEDWHAIMFISDLEDLILAGVEMRRMKGTFAFVKRGANYGFKLLELDPIGER